jgi:hypothetical protein
MLLSATRNEAPRAQSNHAFLLLEIGRVGPACLDEDTFFQHLDTFAPHAQPRCCGWFADQPSILPRLENDQQQTLESATLSSRNAEGSWRAGSTLGRAP